MTQRIHGLSVCDVCKLDEELFGDAFAPHFIKVASVVGILEYQNVSCLTILGKGDATAIGVDGFYHGEVKDWFFAVILFSQHLVELFSFYIVIIAADRFAYDFLDPGFRTGLYGCKWGGYMYKGCPGVYFTYR